MAADEMAPLMEAALELALAAWLDRTPEAALPARVLKIVVEPMVETMLEPPEMMVVTMGSVAIAVTGIDVAPTTPPTPRRVVVTDVVKVDPPEVTTEAIVDVATGVAAPDDPPSLPVGEAPCIAVSRLDIRQVIFLEATHSASASSSSSASTSTSACAS